MYSTLVLKNQLTNLLKIYGPSVGMHTWLVYKKNPYKGVVLSRYSANFPNLIEFPPACGIGMCLHRHSRVKEDSKTLDR